MYRKLLFTAVVIFCLLAPASASDWQKYIAKDKSFSFHYPAGWKVEVQDSIMEITNPEADEQILVLGVPFNKKKTPKELAQGMIDLLKKNMPDIAASDWKDTPGSKDRTVFFRLSYTNNGKAYLSEVLLLKEEANATWFSFTGPKEGYSQQRAAWILQGLVESLAEGDKSEPPYDESSGDDAQSTEKDASLTARINKNADAFLFVLEFSLGAPLSAAEEKVILNELKSGWSKKGPELQKTMDNYPVFVQMILTADQKDLAEIRETLEDTLTDWLKETDQNDPAVKIVRRNLMENGKTVAEGNPPLIEIGAASYAEIMAYSEMLQKNPAASVENIPAAKVSDIRKKLIAAWKGFSALDKNSILTAPAVWMTARQVMKFGELSEQTKMRTMLAKLWTPPQETTKQAKGSKASSKSSSSSTRQPMSMAAHNTLMEMQKTTFNTYMWSRGYSGWTPMGKF